MRFIIHGAGAVGCLVGGLLADSGEEVVLIARRAIADAVNQSGLLIETPSGMRRVKNLSAVTSPAGLAPREDDVIFLTVKSSQTANAVQSLREVFPDHVPVFCVQNGIRNEELAARRFRRVYGVMTGLCVNTIQPGRIAHTLSNRIGIGDYPRGCDALGIEVAEKIEKAGFSVTAHDSIMAVKWSKLLLNLNNATLAIIDNYLQLSYATPAICRFMADVMEEGLHALEVAGISIVDPENPYDIAGLIEQWQNAVEDPEKLFAAQNLPPALRSYPSTWTDLKEKRGETEAGFFNGEIILLGEKYHIPTPYNSTLLNTVEEMAAEGAQPGRYAIDELAAQVEQRRLMIYNS